MSTGSPLLHPPPVDLSFLREFLRNELCEQASPLLRQLILGHFLVQFQDRSITDDARVLHLRELVLPLLKSTLSLPQPQRDEVLKGRLPAYLSVRVHLPAKSDGEHKAAADAETPLAGFSGAEAALASPTASGGPMSLLQLFMDVILTGDTHTGRLEELRTELLGLSTMFIHFMSPELMDHRKNLIKFAWQHLKSEDPLAKQAAYINVCRFIEVSV